ncbi:MAG: ferredoxin [Acidimicrobiales bacterium]|nr:ferredoxin [Acidimicrobiales bacterium]
MMKVHVDDSRCTGHARCNAVSPEFYELDELGYNAWRGKSIEVPPEREDEARRGAAACPELAITIES